MGIVDVVRLRTRSVLNNSVPNLPVPKMKVIINDWHTIVRNYKYLYEFEKRLYLKYFPNQNEREPFKKIIDRIWNDEYPKTDIILFIDEDKVIAGCVSDYYPNCKTIEPIYLVVDEEYRNQGLARRLLDTIFSRKDIDDMFVEVDNPELVEIGESSIDPKTRIEIYKKLGFDIVDINYVQPPLDEGMDFERTLLLMNRTKKPPLTNKRLRKFLTEFYEGLDSIDTDEYRELMKSLE